MKLKKQNGFTLVELLISISLIIILMGVMIPAVNAVRSHGKSTMAKAEVAALRSAIISYHTRYNMFPLYKDGDTMAANIGFGKSSSGSEVLDVEDGWQLLENIAAKNSKGIFLLELDNYKEGDTGEVLDPYGNPYLFLFDIHNTASEFIPDGTVKINDNSFDDYRKKNTEYKIKSSGIDSSGIRVLYFNGDEMEEID
jgi:prepilin-type N-terminal cleavage/methylation domain-containing protein